ncbi:hypothetical protein ACFW1M_27815 [Streptomyces inhibens]|uniref:hypothetical protein n=1 Tax=Streptomyces inhibens TaxID=2293571 RepID=UPI0036A94F3F
MSTTNSSAANPRAKSPSTSPPRTPTPSSSPPVGCRAGRRLPATRGRRPLHRGLSPLDQVAASLRTDTPASQALSTPLGLFLARTIYNPHPDEDPVDLPHPDELLNQSRFPNREDIDAHLFSAFIPAAYRPHPHRSTRWSPDRAQRTPALLARHLQHNLDGTPDLAWWQLHKALPQRVPSLAVGLLSALVYVLLPLEFLVMLGSAPLIEFDVLVGLALLALPPMLVVGWVAAKLTSAAKGRGPRSGIRWNRRRYPWLAAGLLVGLAGGITAGSTIGFKAALATGLGVGLTFGPVLGLLAGLASAQPDLARAVGPGAVLARDRHTFWIITLVGGVSAGFATGLATGQARGFVAGFVLGFLLGLLIGSWSGLSKAVWVVFLVTRIGLAMLRRVPWRFMSFLADAHEQRGVLRQVGAVYQLRHFDLQRHLAERRP